MGIFQRIKAYFFNTSLPAKSVRNTAKPVRNLDDARTVGILFNATDVDERNAVLRYADKLRKQNKQVSLLGFIATVDKEATFPFEFFTQKDIDWAERPKGTAVQTFVGQGYDVFINLHTQTTNPTEHIALHVPAGMKIGPVAAHPDAYDLMIDLPAHKAQLATLIQQYERVLEKTATKVA